MSPPAAPARALELYCFMGDAAKRADLTQLGWRLGIGVALIIGGYAALLLIPFVMGADLGPQFKAALAGLLGLTPLLTKLAAIALIGRPASI